MDFVPTFVYDRIGKGGRYVTRCGYIDIERSGKNEWHWQLDLGYDTMRLDATEGWASSLKAAKAEAEETLAPGMIKLVAEQAAKPGATGEGVDVTGKAGEPLALRGLPRPTMRWKSEGYYKDQTLEEITNASGEAAAASYAARFFRENERRMPVMYSTHEAANATGSCSSGRLIEAATLYLCCCCGESVEDRIDATGWILQEDAGDEFGVPGSPLCTLCAYMTIKMCPVYAKSHALGTVVFWRITGRDGYEPSPHMRAEGGCLPRKRSGKAHRSSWEELKKHRKMFTQGEASAA